jgi:hypothetical protein
MDKKGVIMQALIGLAILIVTFFVILQIYKAIGAGTEGVAAEEFCYFTNAIKAKLIPDLASEGGFDPQGCQKIDIKTALPAKSATKDIGDLTAKCWRMWLEGITEDGKSKDVLVASSNFGKDCFICYTFFLERGTTITSGKLSESLANEVYRVADGSDKCAPKGGGYCQESCETLENPSVSGVPAEEVHSEKCNAPEKCCVAAVKGNDCVNKGGLCEVNSANFFGKGDTNFARNSLWTCAKRGESCFVPQKQFLSYVDYIQEGGKGPGMLALSKDVAQEGLKSGNMYAVVFNEDTTADVQNGLIGGGILGSSGALAGIVLGFKAGALVGTAITPGIGTVVGGVSFAVLGGIGTLVGYNAGAGITNLFASNTFDQIVIAEREEVQNLCTIQYGVKG